MRRSLSRAAPTCRPAWLRACRRPSQSSPAASASRGQCSLGDGHRRHAQGDDHPRLGPGADPRPRVMAGDHPCHGPGVGGPQHHASDDDPQGLVLLAAARWETAPRAQHRPPATEPAQGGPQPGLLPSRWAPVVLPAGALPHRSPAVYRPHPLLPTGALPPPDRPGRGPRSAALSRRMWAPVTRSMIFRIRISRGFTKVIASPPRPYRPVRPIRWT
jgi:hypothetical protein